MMINGWNNISTDINIYVYGSPLDGFISFTLASKSVKIAPAKGYFNL